MQSSHTKHELPVLRACFPNLAFRTRTYSPPPKRFATIQYVQPPLQTRPQAAELLNDTLYVSSDAMIGHEFQDLLLNVSGNLGSSPGDEVGLILSGTFQAETWPKRIRKGRCAPDYP